MTDALTRRHSLPPGAVVETVGMDDPSQGRPANDPWPIRTLRWAGREGGPGSILFLTGRGDFAEKYAETFWDLTEAGWGVFTFDWRGQGLSGRLGDTAMKGHAYNFLEWIDDLDSLIERFEALMPSPWFAVAHSMGGHLLLRDLGGGPRKFERAVLLAPMLGLRAKPLGPGPTRLLARSLTALGLGGRYVLGGGDYVPGAAGSMRQRLLTSDAARYSDEGWWVAQNRALALGSATWGWLDAAFRSCDALWADALERVATPVLMLNPEDDGLVDNARTRAAEARLPDGRLEVVAGAGHELLREADAIRAAVLGRIVAFLTGGV